MTLTTEELIDDESPLVEEVEEEEEEQSVDDKLHPNPIVNFEDIDEESNGGDDVETNEDEEEVLVAEDENTENDNDHDTHNATKGLAKVVRCPPGFQTDPDNLNRCLDIDECQLQLNDCTDDQECINEHGSYRCTDIQKHKEFCPLGFYYNSQTQGCEST